MVDLDCQMHMIRHEAKDEKAIFETHALGAEGKTENGPDRQTNILRSFPHNIT